MNATITATTAIEVIIFTCLVIFLQYQYLIHIDYGNEERQDDRAEDESERSEEDHAAENREKDEDRRRVESFAEEICREHVVDKKHYHDS